MTCSAAERGFLVELYSVHQYVMCMVMRGRHDTRVVPVRGVDHLIVHRHVMCVVIRPQLVPLILCAGT